jgi:hypothetical protein
LASRGLVAITAEAAEEPARLGRGRRWVRGRVGRRGVHALATTAEADGASGEGGEQEGCKGEPEGRGGVRVRVHVRELVHLVLDFGVPDRFIIKIRTRFFFFVRYMK